MSSDLLLLDTSDEEGSNLAKESRIDLSLLRNLREEIVLDEESFPPIQMNREQNFPSTMDLRRYGLMTLLLRARPWSFAIFSCFEFPYHLICISPSWQQQCVLLGVLGVLDHEL